MIADGLRSSAKKIQKLNFEGRPEIKDWDKISQMPGLGGVGVMDTHFSLVSQLELWRGLHTATITSIGGPLAHVRSLKPFKASKKLHSLSIWGVRPLRDLGGLEEEMAQLARFHRQYHFDIAARNRLCCKPADSQLGRMHIGPNHRSPGGVPPDQGPGPEGCIQHQDDCSSERASWGH